MSRISVGDYKNALESYKPKQNWNILDKFMDREPDYSNHEIEISGFMYLECTNFTKVF